MAAAPAQPHASAIGLRPCEAPRGGVLPRAERERGGPCCTDESSVHSTGSGRVVAADLPSALRQRRRRGPACGHASVPGTSSPFVHLHSTTYLAGAISNHDGPRPDDRAESGSTGICVRSVNGLLRGPRGRPGRSAPGAPATPTGARLAPAAARHDQSDEPVSVRWSCCGRASRSQALSDSLGPSRSAAARNSGEGAESVLSTTSRPVAVPVIVCVGNTDGSV